MEGDLKIYCCEYCGVYDKHNTYGTVVTANTFDEALMICKKEITHTDNIHIHEVLSVSEPMVIMSIIDSI